MGLGMHKGTHHSHAEKMHGKLQAVVSADWLYFSRKTQFCVFHLNEHGSFPFQAAAWVI